jgi:hypothetical protein
MDGGCSGRWDVDVLEATLEGGVMETTYQYVAIEGKPRWWYEYYGYRVPPMWWRFRHMWE